MPTSVHPPTPTRPPTPTAPPPPPSARVSIPSRSPHQEVSAPRAPRAPARVPARAPRARAAGQQRGGLARGRLVGAARGGAGARGHQEALGPLLAAAPAQPLRALRPPRAAQLAQQTLRHHLVEARPVLLGDEDPAGSQRGRDAPSMRLDGFPPRAPRPAPTQGAEDPAARTPWSPRWRSRPHRAARASARPSRDHPFLLWPPRTSAPQSLVPPAPGPFLLRPLPCSLGRALAPAGPSPARDPQTLPPSPSPGTSAGANGRFNPDGQDPPSPITTKPQPPAPSLLLRPAAPWLCAAPWMCGAPGLLSLSPSPLPCPCSLGEASSPLHTSTGFP